MIYFLKNSYTEKLYNKIKMSVVNLSLISIETIEKLQNDDILVVDDNDRELIRELNLIDENVIILGESDDDYRVISKYQSIERIKSLISDQFFPLYFCTSTEVMTLTEMQMYRIAEKFSIEYIFCLNFNPDSKFSLFQWSMNDGPILQSKEILYVINNISDLRFEPSSEILSLIESTRKRGNTMVFSFPLKGQLDFYILEITNFLITVSKDKTRELVLDEGYKNPKVIEVIIRGEEIIYCDCKRTC